MLLLLLVSLLCVFATFHKINPELLKEKSLFVKFKDRPAFFLAQLWQSNSSFGEWRKRKKKKATQNEWIDLAKEEKASDVVSFQAKRDGKVCRKILVC